MKKNIRALALAAVLLALAPAVGGREKPNPDDFNFEGIEAGADIGEKTMTAASAMVMDACDAFGELSKIWSKKGQKYSQTVSDWYGACDNMQTAWNDSWAKVIELAMLVSGLPAESVYDVGDDFFLEVASAAGDQDLAAGSRRTDGPLIDGGGGARRRADRHNPRKDGEEMFSHRVRSPGVDPVRRRRAVFGTVRPTGHQ